MTRDAAYRRTLYRAGDVMVRVGRKNRGADAWMARHGAREACFITAWNPMSRAMPRRFNDEVQKALRRDLRGLVMRDGEGSLGQWREEMLLVIASAVRLMRLARRCRQAAIVVVPRGRPARLVYRKR